MTSAAGARFVPCRTKVAGPVPRGRRGRASKRRSACHEPGSSALPRLPRLFDLVNNRPFSKFTLATLITIIISVLGISAKLMAAFLRMMKEEVEDITEWKTREACTFETSIQRNVLIACTGCLNVYFRVCSKQFFGMSLAL